MAAATSFTRRLGGSGGGGRLPAAGMRTGPNGTLLLSTGLSDLDRAIGGGIPLGGLLVLVEDMETPHHLLLLRYFMAQALSHAQPVLFASSLAFPKAFLGTLPAPVAKSQGDEQEQPEAPSLRIAWQYRKYEEEGTSKEDSYSTSFDLRRPYDQAAAAKGVECLSMSSCTPSHLSERCAHFVASRCCSPQLVGRIAFHSLAAPQCAVGSQSWDLLALLLYLKSLLTNANALAMITIPASLLPVRRRWEHLADILLSVTALPDEDGGVLDHQEASALLQVHKLPSVNTQVPNISKTAAYAVKVRRKKEVVLEQLHLAPIDTKLSSACNASD